MMDMRLPELTTDREVIKIPKGPPFPATLSFWVRSFALAKGHPDSIDFSQTLLRYNGLRWQERNPSLLWGIHGIESCGRAFTYAGREAKRSGLTVYQLEIWYYLERPDHGLGRTVNEERARQTGFFSLARLEGGFRVKLRRQFLSYLEEDPEYGRIQLENSPEAIAFYRPMVIHRLFEDWPWLSAVQHTVSVGAPLRVITFRHDPNRYLHIGVRFHEEIRAYIGSSVSVPGGV